MASYQESHQDEGYSEAPLTVRQASTALPPWLAALSLSEKTDFVMRIIDTLPTSEVCKVHSRIAPRLFINFFSSLPAEICLKILGFLDPLALIYTAQACRQWMELALDRALWEQLYLLEGFRVIRPEILAFEASMNSDKSRPSGSSGDEHASKRRATPQRILPNLQTDDDYEMPDADTAPFKPSIFGQLTTEPKDVHLKEQNYDVDVSMTSPKSTFSSHTSNYPSRPANISQTTQNHRVSTGSSSIPMPSSSSLIVLDRSDSRRKINWHYLYAQRRRLEANWVAEKYTNFQLPHPMHPDEAHEECIYTIQHSGKYLVSGSRDKTLRIWNLNTQRLIRPPLRAHNGSVLCLQFDADPEEDLIVSGSSDATIVIWKFSTGKVIQRLRKAHRESVLNVRFDKRVLITCSKDKTIKIFNRRPMEASEYGYPDSTRGIDPVPINLNNFGFNPRPAAPLPTLPAYTMLGCLEGHGAAVNAVQIFGDEVVSASGDRTVKVWNWPERICTRTLIGHTKGIACVQYDGRRIVSGSSDNEVKVFDKESGLEVASLKSHTNLVRTVQAGFGDLPYSREEDTIEARNIDREYFKAVESGEISQTELYRKKRPKNSGSKKPADITAYGARLPPGGGGGRFGRIVSGSYDETIIIWRRDKEGVWRPKHTLRQEEAAHLASRAAQQAREAVAAARREAAAASQQDVAEPYLPILPRIPNSPYSDAHYRALIDQAVAAGPTALRTALQTHPQMMTSQRLGDRIGATSGTTKNVLTSVALGCMAVFQQAQQAPQAVAVMNTSPGYLGSSTRDNAVDQTPSALPGSASAAEEVASNSSAQQTTAPLSVPSVLAPAATTLQTSPHALPPNPNPNPPAAAAAHHHHPPANMARVFKLQFDARRIICCSQTSIIVGWDFANGDEQITEASRFFAPIE